MTKWCPYCQRELPVEAFASYPSRPRDSYCRECRRRYQAERNKRPEIRARHLEDQRRRHHERMAKDAAYREARRRWMATTRERLGRELINEAARFYYWRDHDQRQKRMYPSRQHYRAPSSAEVVPAEPLVEYLRHLYREWGSERVHDVLEDVVSDRGLYRLLEEHQPVVALDFADRLLTRGLGRPDLLNALYPVEES